MKEDLGIMQMVKNQDFLCGLHDFKGRSEEEKKIIEESLK